MEKVHLLLPEIALFAATCVVMVVGLSPSLAVRRLCAPISALGLIVAGLVAAVTIPPAGASALPGLVPFAKVTVAVVGLLLLLLGAGTVDRTEEGRIAAGLAPYNPLRTNRAEFYSFFLFSLTGVMLTASADDLIWLFLALELTSLPTYIMVTISSGSRQGRAQEAGVKYFFLGALGAATFLYGFALLYGGTGSTNLGAIRAALAGGEIGPIAMAGLLLSILGVSFKIAAVPMHFYTPDVYEGSSAPVAAFLAFVPKTAGFVAIILLASTVGWDGGGLPEPVRLTLWVIAALTMTVGNVLAILQDNVKRILAYSSIAHSGYMLTGVIAGPGDRFSENGLAAVLFYLLAYGIMNMGAFAVLACLERPGTAGEEPGEIQNVADLRGLCRTHPVLGWTMVLCALSLLGFPPLLGFLGKFALFSAAIAKGEYVLVVVLGLNSATAAFYYLRLVAAPLLEGPEPAATPAAPTPFVSRPLAAMICAGGVVILAVFANVLMQASAQAAQTGERGSVVRTNAAPAANAPP